MSGQRNTGGGAQGGGGNMSQAAGAGGGGRIPNFPMPTMPAPPLPPEHPVTEQERQVQIQYEQWLYHHQQVLSMQLKYFDTEVTKLRKGKKVRTPSSPERGTRFWFRRLFSVANWTCSILYLVLEQ
jgi:hypothetical protein